jgi:hypothetical protein
MYRVGKLVAYCSSRVGKNQQPKNITDICPHPAAVFNEKTTVYAKAQIAAVHSIMLKAHHATTANNNIIRRLQQLQDLFDES